MTIAILDHGSGNLHSVARALAKVGGDAEVTDDPQRVLRADAIVIPGVGHVGRCLEALTALGLDRPILATAREGRPILGVCLGLQVLFERSEETDRPGLGLLTGTVRRLPEDVKVPHMGWNTVRWVADHPLVAGMGETSFYFVHSYAADPDPVTTVGITEHGRPFAAAVASGSVFATQFHPEKSGEAGLELYERFVKAVAST